MYLNNGSFKSEVDPHQSNLREKKKIFKSWQVCDWLAKWLIVLGFMDLRWPRVNQRSNVGLVIVVILIPENTLSLYTHDNLNWLTPITFCTTSRVIRPWRSYWRWILIRTCDGLVPSGTQLAMASPDSKVHGGNMGPIWVRQGPGRPHVGPMNFVIWGGLRFCVYMLLCSIHRRQLSAGLSVCPFFSLGTSHIYVDGTRVWSSLWMQLPRLSAGTMQLGRNKLFHHIFFYGCNYLSMLDLNILKMSHWCINRWVCTHPDKQTCPRISTGPTLHGWFSTNVLLFSAFLFSASVFTRRVACHMVVNAHILADQEGPTSVSTSNT